MTFFIFDIRYLIMNNIQAYAVNVIHLFPAAEINY